MKIAIPTNAPGGLEAERSDHFGHCDLFTVVTLQADKTVAEIAIVENGGHEPGGCMAPVKLLADAGVEAIVVGGMGARPMQGFSQAGIEVYFADRTAVATVGNLVGLFIEDKLPKMHANQVCQGSGNCQH